MLLQTRHVWRFVRGRSIKKLGKGRSSKSTWRPSRWTQEQEAKSCPEKVGTVNAPQFEPAARESPENPPRQTESEMTSVRLQLPLQRGRGKAWRGMAWPRLRCEAATLRPEELEPVAGVKDPDESSNESTEDLLPKASPSPSPSMKKRVNPFRESST